MFKKLKELYNEYKPYVRVDLIMYGVLILSIILYFIFSIIFDWQMNIGGIFTYDMNTNQKTGFLNHQVDTSCNT